jgi:autotransporter-associated beta strand protein
VRVGGWSQGDSGEGQVKQVKRVLMALGLPAGLAAFGLVVPEEASAAQKTWTGGSMVDSEWQTGANWGGTAPSAGDDLVFPSGASRLTNHNNFPAGTSFNTVSFSGDGYVITGNNIGATNGITSSVASGESDTLSINLVIGSAASVTVSNSGATLILDGVLLGSGNGLQKEGAGTLRLGGASSNTYTGETLVNAGTLELGKTGGATAIAGTGPLTIGDGTGTDTVQLLASNQLADTVVVTVNNSGVLDLNGFSDAIDTLALQSGTSAGALVSTGVGTLTLGGDVTVTVSGTGATRATISGNLDLGGATRTLTVADGTDTVDLEVAAAISGSGGVTKAGAGTLRFSGGANTYTGTTTVNAGLLELFKSDGVTAVPGALVIGDGTGTDTVRLLSNNQIANGASVTVNNNGVLDLNGKSDTVGGVLTLHSGTASAAQVTTGVGTLTLGGNLSLSVDGTGATGVTVSGKLDLGGSTRQFSVASGAAAVDIDITAAISGTGSAGITKTGGGTMRFAGASANTYPGTTTVSGGTLLLNKSAGDAIAGSLVVGDSTATDTVQLAASNQIADTASVTVSSGGVLDLNGFSDTIGALTVQSGAATGAQVTTGAGMLTLGGNASLTVDSTGAVGRPSPASWTWAVERARLPSPTAPPIRT